MALFNTNIGGGVISSGINIPSGYCFKFDNNGVGLIQTPTSDSMFGGAQLNWDIIANTSGLTKAVLDSNPATYVVVYGYDATNDTWTALTATSDTFEYDLTGYELCLIHQFNVAAGTKCYFV